MVQVKYSARIIADSDFIEWLINHDKLLFLKLTHIKSSSIDAKKEHNIILSEDVEKIMDKKIIKESNLRAAFKLSHIPEAISPKLSTLDKRIIMAIVMAMKKPFRTYIFTTKDKINDYRGSSHYNNVKSISAKAEEDAVAIINSFWKEFKAEREDR